jgi:hypothetical protein
MYKNNFAVAIKHNNDVLSDKKGVVSIPFGTEYKVFLKNLNTKPAHVHVYIDGEKVTPSTGIRIDKQSSKEVSCFDNSQNHFKFVEKTKGIKKYRGNKIEDSLVRVEVKFEEEFKPSKFGEDIGPHINENPFRFPKQPDIFKGPHVDPYNPMTPYCSGPGSILDGAKFDSGVSFTTSSGTTLDGASGPIEVALNSTNKRDYSETEGITVKGSPAKASEKLKEAGLCLSVEEATVFIFKLQGSDELEPIETTKTKKKCSSCGKKFKNKYNYCPFDGTYLDKELT